MKEYQIKWKMFDPFKSQYGEFEESEGSSRWQNEEITKMQLKGLRTMTANKVGKADRIWDIKVFFKSFQIVEVTSDFKP